MPPDRLPLIALVGRPNVGKSSLFNRLAKSQKAIVDPTPGVTRDRHYEKVAWDDKTFLLVDTGGIEATEQQDQINRLIQEQTRQAIEEADIILFLLDGREGVMPDDLKVVELLRRSDKEVHYLVNKIDDPSQEQRLLLPFYELGVERLWPFSAAHGFGVSDFFSYLAEGLAAAPEEELPPETIRIAFLGRPNVGKSSLVNRLVGEERMVVSNVPGTTRDSVDTLLERKGRHYLLIDTAGIRRKGKVQEKIEKFSVMGALRALERCDLAFILIDAEEGITEQDTKVIGYCMERGRACLLLINKWDLIANDAKRQKQLREEVERATHFIGFAPVHRVSALAGTGVAKLFPLIDQVYSQYGQEFSTARLNKVLTAALAVHNPPMHQGRRLKFYYVTQVATRPPTFVMFVNYPKGVHFSYYRFLVNQFREQLGLDKTPLKILLRERQRKQYGE